MARFKYIGRDRYGKKTGVINATSKREAVSQLKEKGIRLLELNEVPETVLNRDITIGNPVKLQDFVVYLRQFATLIKAGVTVVESTVILAEQTESKYFKKILYAIEQDLREGIPLSAAAAKHKKIFSNMFVNMIRAGEVAGNMDDTLERLAVHYEKQHFTKQKIMAALSYPLVVGFIAIVVVIFLLVKIVPTFVVMFDDFGADLPAITKFVLRASDFMQHYWWLIALLIIIVLVGIALIRSKPTSKYYLDIILLRLPIFGKLLQKAAIARMTRTLSSLFSSSVPILQAVAIVENTVENEVISKVLKKSRDSLEQGQSFTAPMRKHWVFPPLVTQMIAIGEQSGSLDEMLAKVADFYEKEVDIATDRLKSLIEPLMIVILALLVGTIVASIMIPMFEFYKQVG